MKPTQIECDARVIVRSFANTNRQALVTIERIKQLGCWPSDFKLTRIAQGQHAGHLYVEAGARKGRRRTIRITPEGDVIA